MKEPAGYIIIKYSKEEDWYFELDGKIIPYDREDNLYFYMNIRGEDCRIPKTDANYAKEYEFDLDEDVMHNIDVSARRLGITRDEFMNKLLEMFIENRKKQGENNETVI